MNRYLSLYISMLYDNYPQLFLPFDISKYEAISNILKSYEYINKIMKRKYPKGHTFMKNPLDGCNTMFAYLMYVVPIFLNEEKIMEDFLRRKLVCKNKEGYFDIKAFNEAFSELEIFIYLFIGIFCSASSDLYKSFISLRYESNGQDNKKFEYSFCFRDYDINVEVKALTCAPEIRDKVNLFEMKHGDKFYKYYFPNHKVDIPLDYISDGIELSSNYRQLCNNIAKIKKKCSNKERNINLGFIMINYGTSREEYISYLLNPQFGYIHHAELEHIDAIILFSMCTATDLLMNKILQDSHILTYANPNKNIFSLLHELRLDNYITDSKYECYINDEFGLYKGIKYHDMVTIQPAYEDEEFDFSDLDRIKQYDNIMKNFVE